MPLTTSPAASEALCEPCRLLTPAGRGHTFLVPARRDGAFGYLLCVECGALWQPQDGPGGRYWLLCRIEQRDPS